jgi:hypothetical protein
LKSLDKTMARYDSELAQLRQNPAMGLPDINFDTGQPTRAGSYKLTDDSYAFLLGKLEARHFDMLTPALRENILSFYGNLQEPLDTKRHKEEFAKLQERLQELKQAPTVNPETVANEGQDKK